MKDWANGAKAYGKEGASINWKKLSFRPAWGDDKVLDRFGVDVKVGASDKGNSTWLGDDTLSG